MMRFIQDLGAALLALAILVLFGASPSMAQGVDVTSGVSTLFDLVVSVLGGVAIFVLRAEMAKATGVQVSDASAAKVQAFIDNAAHIFLNQHLLKDGKITVDTKNVGANYVVGLVNAQLPAELQQLNLTTLQLTQLAEGSVAKALNLMPSAPPYAPAAPAPQSS